MNLSNLGLLLAYLSEQNSVRLLQAMEGLTCSFSALISGGTCGLRAASCDPRAADLVAVLYARLLLFTRSVCSRSGSCRRHICVCEAARDLDFKDHLWYHNVRPDRSFTFRCSISQAISLIAHREPVMASWKLYSCGACRDYVSSRCLHQRWCSPRVRS